LQEQRTCSAAQGFRLLGEGWSRKEKKIEGNATAFFDRLLRPCVNDRLRLAVGGIVNDNLLRGNGF
jgi:hypothetical protein